MRALSRLGSRGFVCALGLAAVAGTGAGFVGCSQHDVSQITSDLLQAPAPEVGQLELALTSRGASGALYRLRQASFEIFNQEQFFAGFLQSDSDPLATSLETTLDIGNYQILLFSGWYLEKVEGNQVTRVQAQLLSPESQDFSISANGETTVRYRFQTNGEIIEFGQGRLIVQIDVDEQSSPPPTPPGDAGPGVALGEPLQIVDGNVGPNPFGINAALFAAVAPSGTDLVVTSNTDQICVQGSIQPVLNGDFATQWGAVFGLAFLDADGIPQPWNLASGEVTGFAFTVSGPDFPFTRFTALPGGADPTTTNFCSPLAPIKDQSLLEPLDSLTRDCWNPGGEQLSTMSLSNIGWNIVSDVGVAHTFDFCISDLRPILR